MEETVEVAVEQDSSPTRHHQVNPVELDRCRAEACANLHNADCEQLLERLRNVCLDNPTIVEFDALMVQIKKAKCYPDDVADAFQYARNVYQELHPGEQFPLAAPQWVKTS